MNGLCIDGILSLNTTNMDLQQREITICFSVFLFQDVQNSIKSKILVVVEEKWQNDKRDEPVNEIPNEKSIKQQGVES